MISVKCTVPISRGKKYEILHVGFRRNDRVSFSVSGVRVGSVSTLLFFSLVLVG